MPNLDHMPECDPDYNVTLTPDMYCDMRQAMSMTHNMDTSMVPEHLNNSNGSLPTSPTAGSRPSFYIESSRHTFTVTTNVDNRYPMYPGMPCQSNTASMQPPLTPQEQTVPSHQHQHQQQLCKSNSLPLQYYECDQYNNQQTMDYDDGYYQ
ncbi:unnamed protein product [Strongylus vulgaris]|uniref:Uncharacterized protein n=1 Tax=Strongylus vulgaris TaxID=40348 RepID=A0A3P7IE56_STRVU|nr:unnamed protein product [Strongylus vulgaris]